MRKLTMMMLAASALAVAAPVAAQPYERGYDRGYDQSGYDRGFAADRRAADLMSQYDRLYSQIDREYRSGRMGKNQAKNFFKAIDNQKHAINKAMSKHRGYLDQVEYRNQTNALVNLTRQYDQFQRENRGRYDDRRRY